MALVPAAGRGERLGAELPKALVAVAGHSLLTHAVRGLLASGCVEFCVVAAPAEFLSEFTEATSEFGGRCRIVAGGTDRTESVQCTLDAVPDDACEAFLVHDAARAFTPVSVIHRVVEALASGAHAVVPVLPVSDTVKIVDEHDIVVGTQDRSALRAVQTPQGFAADVLRSAYASAIGAATDDAGLVEDLGIPVLTIHGDHHAMKITTPFDLAVAQAVLATTQGEQ